MTFRGERAIKPSRDAESPNQRNVARPKRRRILLLLALPVVVCFVWFVFVRVAAPANAVRIRAATNTRPPDVATAEPLTLRIGAYNIAHGRGSGNDNWNGGSPADRAARLRRIADFLADADLDLVVLNEVDFDAAWSGGIDQMEAIAQAAGFPYRVEQRNFDLAVPFFSLRFGNAVLSRYPVVEAKRLDFPAHSKWEAALAGKKYGLACTVRLDEHRELRLIAVHLDDRNEAVRRAAAERIRTEAGKTSRPVVVAGDFNSAPPDFPLAQPDTEGRTAIGVLTEDGGFDALPKKPPTSEGRTFPSTAPDRVLDWVLTAPPARLMSREVYPLHESDHRPVVGVVRIPAE